MQRISVTVEVSMNLIDFEKLKLIEKHQQKEMRENTYQIELIISH